MMVKINTNRFLGANKSSKFNTATNFLVTSWKTKGWVARSKRFDIISNSELFWGNLSVENELHSEWKWLHWWSKDVRRFEEGNWPGPCSSRVWSWRDSRWPRSSPSPGGTAYECACACRGRGSTCPLRPQGHTGRERIRTETQSLMRYNHNLYYEHHLLLYYKH